MRRKVAIDEDVTRRVARTLEAAYGDLGYEFIYIADLAGSGAKDEFWAEKFRRFGGEVVLSADKNITRKPHELLAFQGNELICFFMQSPWSRRTGHFKVCHALYWWHWIHKKLPDCRKSDCWQVPIVQTGKGFKKLEVPGYVDEQAKKDAS
ncbi:MAG: hypothetical protein RIM84_08400 [Alphaproteobacteria bacterium]